jgi:adenosylcobinamide-phosphate guanylyltransferase
MTLTALVMAGGKGTRMALAEEKPMLLVGGKPVVELVLATLHATKKVDAIVVAVSRYTPKTAAHLRNLGVQVLETPGKEYVSDMDYVVKNLGLQTVLAVSADLPLLTAEVVDQILDHYFVCGKPALAVAVPEKTRRQLGFTGGYSFDCNGERVVYAGINVVDGRRIDETELEQETYILDRAEVAVNINTVDELQIARKQFERVSAEKLRS